jgi:signal transduction histidine kinase
MKDQNQQSKNLTIKSKLASVLNKNQRNIITILNDISVGLIILNFKKRTMVYSNRYFQSIPPLWRKTILRNIYDHFKRSNTILNHLNVRQEIKIKEKNKSYIYGYSIYQIDEETIAVFISEIASKSIYIESQQENIFFDKLSELISEIAHEIGNPLSGINTSLQVLLHNMSLWSQKKIEDYIKRTIKEINRLSIFLKRMREVSNENSMEIKPANLHQLIQTVYTQNEDLLKQKKIKFYNKIEEDIEVLIDEGAFYQIILNLINNSINILTPNKKIEIYVEDKDELFIKLIYRNNGKYIPEELLQKIFYPLYTTRDEGKGIGLAVSQKLITRMGGTMKAIPPDDGVGAKFVLYIPNKIKS